MLGCPVLWVPEGLPACAALCHPVPPDYTDYNGLQRIGCPIEEFARRHRGLEAGGQLAWRAWLAWLAWLACLAWLAWLAWLAG